MSTSEDDIFAAEDELMKEAPESASSDELNLPWEALGSQATFDRLVVDPYYDAWAQRLHEDEVAFIPPVAGG